MMMVRKTGPVCPNGCKTKSGNRPVKMHRFYVKEGNILKPKGWICPVCKHSIANGTS